MGIQKGSLASSNIRYTSKDSFIFILLRGEGTQGALQGSCPEGGFSEWRARALTHGTVWWMARWTALSWAAGKQADPQPSVLSTSSRTKGSTGVSKGGKPWSFTWQPFRVLTLAMGGKRQRQKSQTLRMTEKKTTRLIQLWFFYLPKKKKNLGNIWPRETQQAWSKPHASVLRNNSQVLCWGTVLEEKPS